MRKLFSLLLLTFFTTCVVAQEKVTLSGYVKDGGNGESLIGANIYKQGTTIGTSSNVYGFYSISLPKGKNTIVFSYIGYQQIIKELDLQEKTSLDIELLEDEKTTLSEVT